MSDHNTLVVNFSEPELRRILSALESGLEYAVECRAYHDLSLGRTTIKNIRLGEMMDNDISEMERIIPILKQRLGIAPALYGHDV